MVDHKKIAICGMGANDVGSKLAIALLDIETPCVLVGATLDQASEALELTSRCGKISMPWIDPNKPVFNGRKHIETCTKNRIKRGNRKRK